MKKVILIALIMLLTLSGCGGSSDLPDDDNDGIENSIDVFPNDPSEISDTDNDGVGDNADVFPNDPFEIADTDNDGIGDNRDNSINANAGVDSLSILNYSLQLNANDTENPEGSPLSFIWEVIEQPDNSLTILTESESATPEFSANMLGVYKIKLVVADGLLNDSEDTVTVTVKEPYSIVYGLYTPYLTATLCSVNGDLFGTGWRLNNCVAYASAGANVLIGIRNNHPEEDLTINSVGLTLSVFIDEYPISADSMIIGPNQSSIFNLTTKTSGELTSGYFVIKDVGKVYGLFLDKSLSTIAIPDSYY